MTRPLLSPLMTLGTDTDECEDFGDSACGAWRCENSPGSYRCVPGCQPGYHVAPTGDCAGESGGGVQGEKPEDNYFSCIQLETIFCSCLKFVYFPNSSAYTKIEEEYQC